MTVETPAQLGARIEGARAARARLRARPLGVTVRALSAAAARWRADAALAAALPALAGLSPPMVAAGLGIAADAFDPGAITELVERELGNGATRRPAPDGPTLVAHVLASNVPALALPAIALACLAGAAVLVKSGRRDPLSAPAFRRALGEIDRGLAATVVTADWRGGDVARDDELLRAADLVVATGSEATLAALQARRCAALVTYGPRVSVAGIARPALADADRVAHAVAFDVALHDQRGCLSPHVVYVETGGALAPPAFAERLAIALEALAESLPPGPADLEERARAQLLRAEGEWEQGMAVHAGRGGTVIYDERAAAFRPSEGIRTVRVHPVDTLSALPALIPQGLIECIGLAGTDAEPLAPGLRARGVARLCPVGRMQRPPLAWPRGQQAPLGALLGRPGVPRLEVET